MLKNLSYQKSLTSDHYACNLQLHGTKHIFIPPKFNTWPAEVMSFMTNKQFIT
jgi:hypothetical protein